MKRTTLFLAVLLLWLHGQGQEGVSSETVLAGLQSSMTTENYWSLRDLGTFLDEDDTRETAWVTLRDQVIYLDEVFEDGIPSRDKFMAYFYANKENLVYDSYLNAYVAFHDHTPQVYPYDYFTSMSPSSGMPQPGISSFQEAKEVVQSLLDEGVTGFKPEAVQACNQISQNRVDEAADIILSCLESRLIMPQQAARYLHRLTNTPSQVRGADHIFHFYSKLLEQKSLEEVVRESYLANTPVQLNWYPDEVDYFARLLLDHPFDPVAIENILYDLKDAKQSRSLFYVTAFLDRLNREDNLSDQVFRICKDGLSQMLPPDFSLSAAIPQENTGSDIRHSLEFWYAHHHAFVWDDGKGFFVPGDQNQTSPLNPYELQAQADE